MSTANGFSEQAVQREYLNLQEPTGYRGQRERVKPAGTFYTTWRRRRGAESTPRVGFASGEFYKLGI